jgi:UDP-GlcNAc:undecaprenyl-phosphate GlcNAc-1-phosphate transferase
VYVQTLSAFALTALLMIFYAPLASHMGLLDRPGPRKQHTGNIPLIGGVAIIAACWSCCPFILK